MSKKTKLLKCLITALFITACGKQEINNTAAPQTNYPAPAIEQDFGPISSADIIPDKSAKKELIKTPGLKSDDTILKIQNETVSLSIEETYAPVIYFDSLEDAYLTSVPKFLATGIKLEAHKPLWKNPRLRDNVTAQELASYTSPKVKIKGHDLELMLQTDDHVTAYDPVVYTHKLQKDDFTYLQYWFFYSFNDTKSVASQRIVHKCGNHQGDWEHVSLKINTAKYSAAKTEDDFLKAIEGVYFSQHNTGQNENRKFKKPGDSDLHLEGTHIKAFVARGTHATYSEPSTGKGYQIGSAAGIKFYDKADGKGTELRSITNLIDITTQPWNKYAGRWGKISNDICNIAERVGGSSNDGPDGPYYKTSYQKTDWEL